MVNISFEYDTVNYASILNTCAKQLHTSVKNDEVSLTGNIAEGYIKVLSLPNGLEIFVAECQLKQDVTVKRTKNAARHYVLRLHNITAGDNATKVKADNGQLRTIYDKAGVTLSNTADSFSVIFSKNAHIRVLFVLFTEEWLLQHFNIDSSDSLLQEYFNDYAKGLGYERLDGEYARLMAAIIENTQHPFAELFVLNRIMLIIERFFTRIHQRLLYSQTHKLTREDVGKLAKAEALLLKDFTQAPPTISALASEVGMSTSKLKSNFKSLYGIPVYKYYLYHKMAFAKEMLLSGDHAVKKVGISLGYKNLSHFATAFKKEMGVLPGELLTS